MSRRFYPPTAGDFANHGGLYATKVYIDVHKERIRAHAKHDSDGNSMERKTFDDPAWLSVLVEEVGEVARALCDHRHAAINDAPGVAAPARRILIKLMREELVQVAAMAVAWIDSIDFDEI